MYYSAYGAPCLGGCSKKVNTRTGFCQDCRKSKCKKCRKEFSFKEVKKSKCTKCRETPEIAARGILDESYSFGIR